MTNAHRSAGSALALCLLLLLGCSHAARPPLPAASADELEMLLDDGVAAPLAPGLSVFLDHPDYAPWSGASGVADVDTGAPLSASHRFRAGSALKVAVATATLQLVEDGELSLDDSLVALLPNSITSRIEHAGAITVRMLLGHTSGIPDFSGEAFHAEVFADPLHEWTRDELLDRALARPRSFAPGEGWLYSNTNYLLLGEILEATTGQTWREVVTERVFARAELHDSSLPLVGDAECAGCARGYELLDGALVDVTSIDPSMAGAAGGGAWITTLEDLAKLLRALTDGRLFDSAATLDAMLDFTELTTPYGLTGYGLGLERYEIGGIVLIGHLGTTAGYRTFVLSNQETGAITSGLMNVRGDVGAFVVPAVQASARAPEPSAERSR